MYWGDDEERRKQRIGEQLRKKKAQRRGEPVSITDGAEIIEEEDPSIKEEQYRQSLELESLRHLLVQQTKMLQQIMDKQETNKVVVVSPELQQVEKKIKERDHYLPTLGEIDVKVIKTEGIETQGEAGEVVKEGQSIKDRVAKLKALKKGVSQ